MRLLRLIGRPAGFILLCLLLTCCMRTNENLPLEMEINTNWQFRQAGSDTWLTAEVPGTVHTDLGSNGIISDFFYRTNEDSVQWIENEDWEYRTTFTVSQGFLERDFIELCFEGLDTYAEVYLNGDLILETDNMFTAYKVDCTGHLNEGSNELRIWFHSPVKKGMEKLSQLDYLIPAENEQAPAGEQTSIFTRKAPFHYGWDWGPRLVTSGIWRPVKLRAWNYGKIQDIYLETVSIDNDIARIFAELEVFSPESDDYILSLYIDGRSSGISRDFSIGEGTSNILLEINIEEPKLWWTNGLGDPHLYEFSFRLQRGREIIDRYDIDYGIRTVRLIQEPDRGGQSFMFEVNGVPVFMKGANIIPSETLTPQISNESYHKLVQNAIDANMNMLRVWGGAIYKDDIFYELCDRNGLLVWQDFMFSCALQPGDEAHLENIRREAEYNVRRLRNRTSVAIWCGNNEVLHGWHNWDWQRGFTPAQRNFMWETYERIFHEILPGVVEKLDPKNPYWSSSPSSAGNRPADRRSGDEHDWTVWFGQQPFSNYGNNVPRFVSEWGLQSFPGMQTIAEFSDSADWQVDSEVMRHRQRSKMDWLRPGFDGNDMIIWYMEMYYRVPRDFAKFTYVSQLLQAKGYKTAIEAHRRAMPHCMGSLYWQLNDCWPAISWSTVDYNNRWKASHYAVRNAFQDIIVSPVIEGNLINTWVISDRMEDIRGQLDIRLIDFNGNILWTDSRMITIPANTSTRIHSVEESTLPAGDRPGSVMLVASVSTDGEPLATNNLYFTAPRYQQLPPSDLWFTVTETDQGYDLELFSDHLERNVFIDIPEGDGVFSDNFFDLLPGQGKKVTIKTGLKLDPETEIRITSLNDLINY